MITLVEYSGSKGTTMVVKAHPRGISVNVLHVAKEGGAMSDIMLVVRSTESIIRVYQKACHACWLDLHI